MVFRPIFMRASLYIIFNKLRDFLYTTQSDNLLLMRNIIFISRSMIKVKIFIDF